MAQEQTGTASVTTGSATVTGAGVDWSGITTSHRFATAVSSDVLYAIASVTQPGGVWTIQLTAPYAGATDPAAQYAIHKDFTPNFHIPLINANDIATRPLLRDWAVIDDANLGGGGGGGGGGAVSSVFGRIGAISPVAGDYNLDLIDDSSSRVRMTTGERSKLTGIQAGAQVNPDIATQAEAEAGTENTHMMTALRVAQAMAIGSGFEPALQMTIDGANYSSTPYALTSGRNKYVHFTGAQNQIMQIPAGLTVGSYGAFRAPAANTLTIRRVAGAAVSINGISSDTYTWVVPPGAIATVAIEASNTAVVDGARTEPPIDVSGPRTYAPADDGFIFEVSTAGTQTIPASLSPGWEVDIHNSSASNITVAGPGANATVTPLQVATVRVLNGGRYRVAVGTTVAIN